MRFNEANQEAHAAVGEGKSFCTMHMLFYNARGHLYREYIPVVIVCIHAAQLPPLECFRNPADTWYPSSNKYPRDGNHWSQNGPEMIINMSGTPETRHIQSWNVLV